MILGDFICRNAKILKNFNKSFKFWLFFTKPRFSQNQAGMDFFFTNKARKLKFDPVITQYSI